jgi:hypothetical protein
LFPGSGSIFRCHPEVVIVIGKVHAHDGRQHPGKARVGLLNKAWRLRASDLLFVRDEKAGVSDPGGKNCTNNDAEKYR